MYLNSVEGEYLPSFFIIKLRTNQAVETCQHEDNATFTHEYIHFLQDLTLPYCIRENLIQLSTFFDRIDSVKLSGEVRLPQTTKLIGEELTTLQANMTWGAKEIIINSSEIENIIQSTHYIEAHGFNLYKYELSFEYGENYHFGARDLLEFIASKIECKHFKSEHNPPDLPYRTVDLIMDFYKMTHISDVKKIALAEYCLLNDNPAHMLISLLKNEGFKEISRLEDGDFVKRLSTAHWKSRGVPEETIQEKLLRRHYQLRNLLLEKYPERDFSDIFLWFDNTMNYVKEHLSGVFLFTNLYNATTHEFRNHIAEIIDRIGIPLLLNNQDELGSFLSDSYNKDQFIQLLLTYEFSDYLSRNDPQCPLCNSCERDRSEIMNDDCLNAPFRRAHQDSICPFGAFAKAHGLETLHWYADNQLIMSQGSVWPPSA